MVAAEGWCVWVGARVRLPNDFHCGAVYVEVRIGSAISAGRGRLAVQIRLGRPAFLLLHTNPPCDEAPRTAYSESYSSHVLLAPGEFPEIEMLQAAWRRVETAPFLPTTHHRPPRRENRARRNFARRALTRLAIMRLCFLIEADAGATGPMPS